MAKGMAWVAARWVVAAASVWVIVAAPGSAMAQAAKKSAPQPRLGAILQAYPVEGTENIAEHQQFAVRFKSALKTPSLRNNFYCEISNIGEKVGARLLTGSDRAAVLRAAGATDQPEWLTFQCLQRFPFKSQVTVSFSPEVEYAAGGKLGEESSARYTVWGDTGFRIECARENARSDCIPFKPITVRFDAEIDDKARAQVALKGADGKLYRPYPSKTREDPFWHDPTFDVIFYETLPESARFELIFPEALKDRFGRPVGVKEGAARERYLSGLTWYQIGEQYRILLDRYLPKNVKKIRNGRR